MKNRPKNYGGERTAKLLTVAPNIVRLRHFHADNHQAASPMGVG